MFAQALQDFKGKRAHESIWFSKCSKWGFYNFEKV